MMLFKLKCDILNFKNSHDCVKDPKSVLAYIITNYNIKKVAKTFEHPHILTSIKFITQLTSILLEAKVQKITVQTPLRL